jgi:hypothetical protein
VPRYEQPGEEELVGFQKDREGWFTEYLANYHGQPVSAFIIVRVLFRRITPHSGFARRESLQCQGFRQGVAAPRRRRSSECRHSGYCRQVIDVAWRPFRHVRASVAIRWIPLPSWRSQADRSEAVLREAARGALGRIALQRERKASPGCQDEPGKAQGQRARSAGENRGRVVPSCRSGTVIWWSSARISTSLSRSLIGRSRSNATAFVTLR